jgi:hypothetical protein
VIECSPAMRAARVGIPNVYFFYMFYFIWMRRGAAMGWGGKGARSAPFLRVNDLKRRRCATHGCVARPKPIGIVYGPGTLLQLVQMVPPVRPLLRHHPPSAQQPVQLFQNSISLTSTTKSQLQLSTGHSVASPQQLYSLGREIWSLS